MNNLYVYIKVFAPMVQMLELQCVSISNKDGWPSISGDNIRPVPILKVSAITYTPIMSINHLHHELQVLVLLGLQLPLP